MKSRKHRGPSVRERIADNAPVIASVNYPPLKGCGLPWRDLVNLSAARKALNEMDDEAQKLRDTINTVAATGFETGKRAGK
jgi:hypothetical protein